MEELYLKIFGQVQDVGFRFAALREARRLGLRGWARNLSDGRVEIVAQGQRAQLDEFLSWARHGPPGASVERVEEKWRATAEQYPDFNI